MTLTNLLLFSTLGLLLTKAQHCNLSIRRDCEQFTEDTCLGRNCCWDPTDDGTPWCFFRSAPPGVCNGDERQECGYLGITEGECQQRNCCWGPVTDDRPWCFFETTYPVRYYIVTSENTSPSGLTLIIEILNPEPEDITPLEVQVSYESAERIHIKIIDPNNERWEIPEEYLPTPGSRPIAERDYEFSYTRDPFTFEVRRILDGELLFTGKSLLYQDQHLSLISELPPNPRLFGLGERTHPFQLRTGTTFTLWSLDNPGVPLDQNLYGVHPFYLEMREANGHGVFLRNSNGMDVVLEEQSLTYHVIGGVLDFYVFSGPEPERAIQQYQEVIGTPALPPYWALGMHQCRWGFQNLSVVEGVVDGYELAGIPLETIWLDIDYMFQFEDFSNDPVNFPLDQLQTFIDKIHENEQHIVPIIDPGIHIREGYHAWDEGVRRDAFIKNARGEIFVGRVWPGFTGFPDFTSPFGNEYWIEQIVDWMKDVSVDGIWIDMNELANFCDGECEVIADEGQEQQNAFDPNNPPYAINNRGSRMPLNHNTLDMDALHFTNIEYNLHNLYGHLEGIATKEAVELATGKRGFVLSRSTFAGTGHHISHWLGDNLSNYAQMAESIPGILTMNLQGIPMVGPDICGFGDDTNEELCARWSALGSFYTFARNHNAIGQMDQYPFLWESVTEASKKALAARYELIPFMYTLLWQAHQFGGTVQRPLFFEWREDENVRSIDDQFLFGSQLMISAVTAPNVTTKDVYLPQLEHGSWYSYWTGEAVSGQGYTTLPADLPNNPVLVHVRSSSIIPRQPASMRIAASKRSQYNLLITLPDDENSDEGFPFSGFVYVDDGESIDVGERSTQTRFDIVKTEDGFSLTSKVLHTTFFVSQPMGGIEVWGISEIYAVYINGFMLQNFDFDAEKEILKVWYTQLFVHLDFRVDFQYRETSR